MKSYSPSLYVRTVDHFGSPMCKNHLPNATGRFAGCTARTAAHQLAPANALGCLAIGLQPMEQNRLTLMSLLKLVREGAAASKATWLKLSIERCGCKNK